MLNATESEGVCKVHLNFVEHRLGALTHLISSDGESSPTQAGHSGGSPALTFPGRALGGSPALMSRAALTRDSCFCCEHGGYLGSADSFA